MRKWLLEALTPIMCGLLVLLAVIGLGRAARASLHARPAYSLTFGDIDCPPPDGLSHQAFLNEVQELTRQPADVHVLDADAMARLHRAFAVHPWVESVRRIEIVKTLSETRQPHSQVRAELAYRHAVLAVCLPRDAIPSDGSTLIATPSGEGRRGRMPARAVDRDGVLLPTTALQGRLPVLLADVTAPSGPAGTRWGDARVAAAARTVAFLQPHLARLRLEDCEVRMVGGDLVFRRPGVRVVWGRAPGQEQAGEAPAEVKLHRLLDYRSGHDGLESLEHDVRLLAYEGRFPLPSETLAGEPSLHESSQLPSSKNCDQVSNSARSWRSCFSDVNAPSVKASSR